MPISGEGHGRAWRCEHYGKCLARHARLDIRLDCPCPRYSPDPSANHLQDFDGVLKLQLAIFFPEHFEQYISELTNAERAAIPRRSPFRRLKSGDHRRAIP
jgi:hypothetical protein